MHAGGKLTEERLLAMFDDSPGGGVGSVADSSGAGPSSTPARPERVAQVQHTASNLSVAASLIWQVHQQDELLSALVPVLVKKAVMLLLT